MPSSFGSKISTAFVNSSSTPLQGTPASNMEKAKDSLTESPFAIPKTSKSSCFMLALDSIANNLESGEKVYYDILDRQNKDWEVQAKEIAYTIEKSSKDGQAALTMHHEHLKTRRREMNESRLTVYTQHSQVTERSIRLIEDAIRGLTSESDKEMECPPPHPTAGTNLESGGQLPTTTQNQSHETTTGSGEEASTPPTELHESNIPDPSKISCFMQALQSTARVLESGKEDYYEILDRQNKDWEVQAKEIADTMEKISKDLQAALGMRLEHVKTRHTEMNQSRLTVFTQCSHATERSLRLVEDAIRGLTSESEKEIECPPPHQTAGTNLESGEEVPTTMPNESHETTAGSGEEASTTPTEFHESNIPDISKISCFLQALQSTSKVLELGKEDYYDILDRQNKDWEVHREEMADTMEKSSSDLQAALSMRLEHLKTRHKEINQSRLDVYNKRSRATERSLRLVEDAVRGLTSKRENDIACPPPDQTDGITPESGEQVLILPNLRHETTLGSCEKVSKPPTDLDERNLKGSRKDVSTPPNQSTENLSWKRRTSLGISTSKSRKKTSGALNMLEHSHGRRHGQRHERLKKEFDDIIAAANKEGTDVGIQVKKLFARLEAAPIAVATSPLHNNLMKTV